MCKRSSRVQPDTQPKSIEHAISWFKDYEAPKAVGKELDGSISLWFHGKKTNSRLSIIKFYKLYILITIGAIDRESAEKALEKQTEGTFLVRLSKRIWGYTVSVKSKNSYFIRIYYIIIYLIRHCLNYYQLFSCDCS